MKTTHSNNFVHIFIFLFTCTLPYSSRTGNSLDGLFGALVLAANAYEEDISQDECREQSDKPVFSNTTQEKSSTALPEKGRLIRSKEFPFRSIKNSNLVNKIKRKTSQQVQEILNNARLAYQQNPRERLDEEISRAREAQQNRSNRSDEYHHLAAIQEEEN